MEPRINSGSESRLPRLALPGLAATLLIVISGPGKAHDFKVGPLPVQASLIGEGVIEKDAEASRYWRFGGDVNFARLMTYVSAHYLDGKNAIEPPFPQPTEGVYHPDAKAVFPTIPAYEAWYAAQGHGDKNAPKIAYVIRL